MTAATESVIARLVKNHYYGIPVRRLEVGESEDAVNEYVELMRICSGITGIVSAVISSFGYMSFSVVPLGSKVLSILAGSSAFGVAAGAAVVSYDLWRLSTNMRNVFLEKVDLTSRIDEDDLVERLFEKVAILPNIDLIWNRFF